MRGRKIPYGYKMSNGRYVIEEKEAEAVKIVFSLTEANKKPSEIHEIVCNMDTDYFAGDIDKSTGKIAEIMEAEGVKRRSGSSKWEKGNVRSILKNEKYVGDSLLQKSYTQDCIMHKRLVNYGARTKYLIHDSHAAIIDRDTYNLAQQEMARRSCMCNKSSKTKTKQGKYSSLYALSEIMICGECGSPYRRVTWTSHGHKLIVWRCINRLDHGSKYCKNSPSINEEKLQNAIVSALNSVYTGDSKYMSIIEDNIGCVLSEEDELGQAITKMENRIREVEKMRDNLISLVTTGAVDIESSDDEFKALNDEEKYLRDQMEQLKIKAQTKTDLRLMLKTISDELENYDDSIIKYNETAVRKIVECVKVVSKTEIEITFKGGFDMTVEVEK